MVTLHEGHAEGVDNYAEGQEGMSLLVYPIVKGVGPKLWNLCFLEREICEVLDKDEDEEHRLRFLDDFLGPSGGISHAVACAELYKSALARGMPEERASQLARARSDQLLAENSGRA